MLWCQHVGTRHPLCVSPGCLMVHRRWLCCNSMVRFYVLLPSLPLLEKVIGFNGPGSEVEVLVLSHPARNPSVYVFIYASQWHRSITSCRGRCLEAACVEVTFSRCAGLLKRWLPSLTWAAFTSVCAGIRLQGPGSVKGEACLDTGHTGSRVWTSLDPLLPPQCFCCWRGSDLKKKKGRRMCVCAF